MGEKYDDCYEYEPYPRFDIQPLARLRDPSGEGFPPETYGTMREWGASGQLALGDYLARPNSAMAALSSDVRQRLEGIGTEPSAQLAAGREVVDRINTGYEQVRMQSAQGQMTLRMLDREDTIPTAELANSARESARAMKQAVADHINPLESAISAAFGAAQDSAVNAVGAQAEAAVNRVGELAYSNTTSLYRSVFQRGLADVPDAGAA